MLTGSPASASLAAIQPPIAPAPTTAMHSAALIVPDHVDDPPAVLGMAEQLDRVDPAPLRLGIAGRGACFVVAPDMGDVAEQVDPAVGLDFVESVRGEE